VAAERGHKVTVLEAADRQAGRCGWRHAIRAGIDLIGIVDWRLAELDHLGVDPLRLLGRGRRRAGARSRHRRRRDRRHCRNRHRSSKARN
jgi:hypothetical protein